MDSKLGPMFGAALALVSALALAPAAAADDDGKGVVAVAYDGKPQRVHPVMILEVDGKLQPQPLRDTLFLEPGKHALRLGPKFDDSAGLQRGAIDSRSGTKVLELEVEAGKRYLIGAALDGRDASAWRPVVHRVEERRAAQP